jgi:hypothetical protein
MVNLILPNLLILDQPEKPSVGFVEHLNRTYIAQQSVNKNIAIVVINLVTPKGAAKLELLFNNPVTWYRQNLVGHPMG